MSRMLRKQECPVYVSPIRLTFIVTDGDTYVMRCAPDRWFTLTTHLIPGVYVRVDYRPGCLHLL